ncbi:MAG: aromatic ring-hydroxylating dioxygenase subunit alpha [Betaproteobacteria bacterium]|nr:aromatic ring-hydroxylating dioxygenase subunit alpha [Betaproteobacteria bacterium]
MSREDADRLKQVRKDITRASHAPGYLYAAKETLQREVDEFFMKDWLFVGREEELPDAGDYMTMRLVGEPVIVARDMEGRLSAFYNMCAHRGVEVAYGNGNARSLRCPYHGWTYDMSGKLRGAAFMKECERFDPSATRMEPIRFGTWRRNMFICFSKDTIPLEEFIRGVETEFGPMLQMEKTRLGNKVVLELDCNWKLACENLMDFYHVRVLHANTFGAAFDWEENAWQLKKDGVSIVYKAGPPTPKAEPLLGKMPWLADKDYSFASEAVLQPNFILFGRIDCARPFVIWPLSESRCRIVVYHCFPEQVFERPDIKEILKIYADFQLAVLSEDRVMIESLQLAMSTRGFKPGRMSVLESPIHHLLNRHIDRVFKESGQGGDA